MISVCIATYNGSKYIREQLDSILSQLDTDDEVIISDDSSTDSTLSLLSNYHDKRIRLYTTYYHSPIYNFENALKNAKGDIIILCDQDDIWLENRISAVLGIFNDQKVSLIVNRCNVIDKEGVIMRNSYFNESNPVKRSFLRNLIHNPYLGCCMAFRRVVLELALPFPKNIPMHDSWIGLLAQLSGECAYLDKPLINYRRHGENVTSEQSPYSLSHRVYSRIILVYHVIKRTIERRK